MLPEITDEELLRAYQLGDESAFNELFRRHSRKIMGYVASKIRNREEAEEVFQAAFSKLHQSRSQYDPKYPALHWLFVVTRTTLMDHLRRKMRRPEDALGLSDAELDRLQPPASAEVPAPAVSLSVLTEEQRQVVQLRVIDELEYDEIAQRLSRSEVGVRKILSRALQRLRNASAGPKERESES